MKKIFLALFVIGTLSMYGQKSKTINWLTIEEAEEANKKEPRKIIVDVYTDWCGWCKKMDKSTFQNEKIAEYVNANFYAVKFNAEQRDSLVFRNSKFKFVSQGKRGYHELAAALLQGKMSYPSIVYLDEELNMIQPIPGYMDAKQFETVINYFAGNHHKDTAFDAYQKTFKSTLNKG
jgi:thioredoxin-related protein